MQRNKHCYVHIYIYIYISIYIYMFVHLYICISTLYVIQMLGTDRPPSVFLFFPRVVFCWNELHDTRSSLPHIMCKAIADSKSILLRPSWGLGYSAVRPDGRRGDSLGCWHIKVIDMAPTKLRYVQQSPKQNVLSKTPTAYTNTNKLDNASPIFHKSSKWC